MYQYIPTLLSNESNLILDYIAKTPELARKIKGISQEKNTSSQLEWMMTI
ncbi:hypothetical protein CMA01_10240 [Carnobacterium maltaromaticum]|nr:hypothetical protein CMA01_10240 [Carnobacterium maltaromaticum]